MSDPIVHIKRTVSLSPLLSTGRHRLHYDQRSEHRGLDSFDVRHLDRWFYEVPKKVKPGEKEQTHVIGYAIHKALRHYDLLPRCLALHELEAIREKGDEFFHQYFHGKLVLGWRARAMDARGFPLVPYLGGPGSEKIIIKWWRLCQSVEHSVPVLLLPTGDGKAAL